MKSKHKYILVTDEVKPAPCELCGSIEELRPYGPKGERICFKCGMKDEESAKRQLDKRLKCVDLWIIK